MALQERIRRLGWAVGLLVLAAAAGVARGAPADVRVAAVRAQELAERVRVTVDLSGPAEHQVFSLSSPDRVVVDLRNARPSRRLDSPPEGRILSGIRSSERGNGDLRLVLDLKEPARARTFLLRPEGAAGHRLAVELEPLRAPARASSPPARAAEPPPRDVVVAIDAGHGGVDPGAIGPTGVQEKRVVLGIARELQQLVRQERGMRAVMTRARDVFLPLQTRVATARKHKADLLVSIHADAYEDRKVSGSSVYALSPRGATNEAARWLAERENAADLVGGVKLDDKDDLLASVLLDLSQTGTIEASLNVGDRVLRELRGVGELHRNSVLQAGFMVLKSPDVPSILVETAFISNPDDERRLTDARYQKSVARAILAGMRRYFEEYAPPGTLLAARRHVIGQGDSLAAVAARYQVTPDALRAANGLRSESLPVGKVLRIPADRGS